MRRSAQTAHRGMDAHARQHAACLGLQRLPDSRDRGRAACSYANWRSVVKFSFVGLFPDTAGTNAMPSYLSMARVAKPSGSLQVRGGERGTPL
jgi:hypothetical protein